MEDSLEYSLDALEIKSSFYNKDFTVYVEGEDDVIFWENAFKTCDKKIHVEDLNGINEVKKIIKLITEKNAILYVAIDNDYNEFIEIPIQHDRIIVTYGHSIENTLYNKHTIQRIVRQFSRKTTNIDLELTNIIHQFEQAIMPLLVLEIANEIYKKNTSILGKNCSKFLVNNSSVKLCQKKIESFKESKVHIFSETELSLTLEMINDKNKPIWYLIRGHFLTNFIINVIKYFVKKISSKTIMLPNENIFPLFADHIDKADDFPLLDSKIKQVFCA